jgi:GNAT superfamily N-acetyltransferase
MKSSNLLIRDARSEELEAMRDVTLAAYAEYESFLPPFAWKEYRDDMVETVGGGGPPAERIVAERDGTIVGSVILYPGNTTFVAPDGTVVTLALPEVRLLSVPPEERGKGIGAALMKECVRRARQAGAVALALHTTDMMQVAMQMYERMGFVRVPETDFQPAPGVVIKGYRLDLNKAMV